MESTKIFMLERKIDFVALIEVINGNPNGDPDAANMPRQIIESRKGLISDVCLKRKIRDYIVERYDGVDGMGVFIRHGVPKDAAQEEAMKSVPQPPKGKKTGGEIADYANNLKKWMCDKFWDVRTFGAVCQRFTAKEGASVDGAIRGALHIGFAESVDPIIIQRIGITCCAVANEKEAVGGKNNTMGTKHIVPYGLYKVTGHILPTVAEKNGFTEEDLEKFWDAFLHMFECDHSAARGDMSVKKLVVFTHDNKWGSAFEDDITNAVQAVKKVECPASFADYDVTVSSVDGVEVKELR